MTAIEIVNVAVTVFNSAQVAGAAIDTPRPTERLIDGQLIVAGWVVGRHQPVTRVALMRHGTPLAESQIAPSRFEIKSLFPAAVMAQGYGYSVELPLSDLQATDAIEVHARLQDGTLELLGVIRLKRVAPASSPMAEIPIPPAEMLFIGSAKPEEFAPIGNVFLEYFIELGGLQPEHAVLDVGCGIGRMAAPLTRYLSPQGCYEGFDIVPQGITWCQEHITTRFPNFHFQLADLYNTEYNRQGRYRASEYRFPYADNTFDFVLLTSVFTHLLPDDLAHYLAEIARVMKPGGRCLISYFILDSVSLAQVKQGVSLIDFQYDYGNYRIANLAVPEAAVAYDEAFIRRLYATHGLTLDSAMHYGTWRGAPSRILWQDILIATKTDTTALATVQPTALPKKVGLAVASLLAGLALVAWWRDLRRL